MPINSLLYPSNVFVPTLFNVDNSCRFNIASSDKLARTSDSGNTKTFTMSFWVKRSTFGADQVLTNITSGSGKQARVFFEGSTEQLEFHDVSSGGSYEIRYITTRLFRDPSAWYNIVIAVNTDDGTAGDRVKIYVNGVRETSFATATQPSSGLATAFNSGGVMEIGSQQVPADFFGGYMAEVINVDGTQLAPTSFGEFEEDSGTWKPIDVSGLTFGTNGYYLEFKQSGTGTNASGIGADTSGNTNHFAVTNLTAVDQSTDTCTNNFATLNPLIRTYGTQVFSNGNLTSLNATNEPAWAHTLSSIGVSNGKWYWEIKVSGATPWIWTGIISEAVDVRTQYLYNENTGTFLYGNNGNKYLNGSSASSFFASLATNDIVSVALDLDNNKITFYKNGTATPNATPLDLPTNLSSTTVFPATTLVNGASISINFGNAPYAISSGNADGNGYGNFEYAVPSGYFSLNTKNLAEYGG